MYGSNVHILYLQSDVKQSVLNVPYPDDNEIIIPSLLSACFPITGRQESRLIQTENILHLSKLKALKGDIDALILVHLLFLLILQGFFFLSFPSRCNKP